MAKTRKYLAYGLAALLEGMFFLGGPRIETRTAARLHNPAAVTRSVTAGDLERKLALRFGVPDAHAYEEGVYQPPSLEGYHFDKAKKFDKDWPEDGIKETLVERFLNSKGQGILKYTTKGKTWAWGIMGNPSDRNDTTNNFLIRDSDGDGSYDEKYLGNEGFSLPDYLK